MEIKKTRNWTWLENETTKTKNNNLKARADFPYKVKSWWPIISIPYLCGTMPLPYE